MVDTLPNITSFSSVRFALQANTQKFTSPLDRSMQTLAHPGDRWIASYNLVPMTRSDAAEWIAFLTNLRGQSGRFYAPDPSGATARGSIPGTPLVNGASQTGSSLITDGWTASQSGILLKGDYVGWDTPSGWREMHVMIADANSDGGGNSTLSIAYPIRESPANNATLIVANCTCIMALADDDQAGWDVELASIFGLTFNAIEVFT